MIVERQRGTLRLVECDVQALKLGLSPGLALADARARIPDFAVAEADPEADQRFILQLAAFCDRVTPMVALDPPHGLMLDVTGCAHLFGGEAALHQAVCARMAQRGLNLRASLAGAPGPARALARFGRCGVCPPGQDEASVVDLPVMALGVDPETTLALSRAGLKNLGDLAARPSMALAARFGEELTTQLARTLGRENPRITPLRAPPRCHADRSFPEPLMDRESLDIVLGRLIADVVGKLEKRGEGGRVLEASFFRADGAVRRITVETGEPSRKTESLLRLFRTRMETIADPLDPGFGFDMLRLSVLRSEPLGMAQISLDGRTHDEDTTADLIDRLVARFGRERVLGCEALDSHHPSRAARLLPMGQASGSSVRPAWPKPEPDEPPRRPLQIFSPPQPIETLAEVPDGPPLRFRWRRVLHDIARAEGPERIAPEWWRDGPDEPTRDYYRVEDAQGRRFWLFRAGLYERASDQPRWYLHGLFA